MSCANSCGMDPLEFRLLNGSQEGTRRVTGLEAAPHRLSRDARSGQGTPAL